jgi:hypothetical protein
MSPEMTVANALTDKFTMEHNGNHMAGMVLGITVTGNRPPVAAHGRTRKMRLWVRERPERRWVFFTPPVGFVPFQPSQNDTQCRRTVSGSGPANGADL